MEISKIIQQALKEDIGSGDITTRALFHQSIRVKAEIIAKEDGIVCGVEAAKEVFKAVEKKIREDKGKEGINRGMGIRVHSRMEDGAVIKKGEVVCVVEGDARIILTAERTALNFLGRLSGIATLTRKYVEGVRPYKVKIMDTRKTTPGLRELEKYAVRTGGGVNHRMGLYDQALIKDNHIAIYKKGLRAKGKGQRASLAKMVHEVRENIKGVKKGKEGKDKGTKKGIKVEVEVENLKEFREAMKAKPDIIMLDNMKLGDIKRAVAIKNKLSIINHKLSTKLEVSGGVTLKNVRAIAKTGVDMISVGSLTHSAPSLDFSLELME